ncbi:patj homolog isoform X2 [Episyrphus balteatus]|uniref:patj homolog isoform X2 n=1 Tax=Episyrphus balteatus TaxID=286459 RepID=UPI002485EDB9|nr:patj homolog isoform X2 [Episyrphus balteatus]
MVLSTEWSQVEVIDLVNDGNGLGFILVGGRSTGVVIKGLIPGGVAERDGRLQCGDHVLQIGEVNLRGFSSEQVATVLRQTGAQVRLIVARPIEPTATDYQALASHAPIIPTKLLSDPEELSRHLYQNPQFAIAGASAAANNCTAAASAAVDISALSMVGGFKMPIPDTELADLPLPLPPIPTTTDLQHNTRACLKHLDIVPFAAAPSMCQRQQQQQLSSGCSDTDRIETLFTTPGIVTVISNASPITPLSFIDSPETETYEVELRKNVYGLGITVAGYVCEEEDLSGIFVKSIIEGSAAEMSGKIQINDRIVAVDGKTLAGVTNHQAVELLRNTDIIVHLTLERFLRGRKFEHLQVALTELKSDTQSQISLPASPSIATLSWVPPKSDADSLATEDCLCAPAIDGGDSNMMPSRDTVDSNMSLVLDRSSSCSDSHDEHELINNNGDGEAKGSQPVPVISNGSVTTVATTPTTALLNNKQLNGSSSLSEKLNGGVQTPSPRSPHAPPLKTTTTTTAPQSAQNTPTPTPTVESVDSMQIAAWKSLGISLEGTVDVEGGIEKRPHHYIRSILEDGPVGKQGILRPGDELLQVNEHKLQGLKHIEVVKILKELPTQVRLICARGPTAPSVINTSQNPEAFETRSLLPGGHQSLQNLLTKAQSESSLYTSSTATLTDQQRSKSVENVSGLALWSTDVTYIDIEKTERGFGFSVLDYQDPLDAEGTVIVIRGLIPGGSAEATNEIFPGDRLVSVADTGLHGLTLDEAVAILKGMPNGITRIGICRPLSTSDSNIASPGDESPST